MSKKTKNNKNKNLQLKLMYGEIYDGLCQYADKVDHMSTKEVQALRVNEDIEKYLIRFEQYKTTSMLLDISRNKICQELLDLFARLSKVADFESRIHYLISGKYSTIKQNGDINQTHRLPQIALHPLMRHAFNQAINSTNKNNKHKDSAANIHIAKIVKLADQTYIDKYVDLYHKIRNFYYRFHTNNSNNNLEYTENTQKIHDKNPDQHSDHASKNDPVYGYTNKPFTDIVSIGIGGSHFGPKLLCNSLWQFRLNNQSENNNSSFRAVNIHFVSSLDVDSILSLLNTLNHETTLFIIISKSFTTVETMFNAKIAKDWLIRSMIDKHNSSHQKILQHATIQAFLSKHVVAITQNIALAEEFGVNNDYIFPLWDEIGGRYSIWSGVSLGAILYLGINVFEEFVFGGYSIDCHVAGHTHHEQITKNAPAMLAFLGFFHNNILDNTTHNLHAISTYSDKLNNFVEYIQQLDMESNGKSVDLQGNSIDYNTGPVVFGGNGSNGQHSYYQLLHQGNVNFCIDFIVLYDDYNNIYQSNIDMGSHKKHKIEKKVLQDGQDVLFANSLAQINTLAFGGDVSSKQSLNHNNSLIGFKGDRPCNYIAVKNFSPYALGMLIAIYEYKVYFQSILWNIDPFNQPGVELGKNIAQQIFGAIHNHVHQLDPYTAYIIDYINSDAS